MKGVVGFLFFMLFLAGFALVLLQGRQTAESKLGPGAARWAGKTWRPVAVAGETIAAQAELRLKIAVDGRVSGFGGCNDFFGTLERSESGVTIGPLGATRKACAGEVMRLEQAFLRTLESSRGIEAEGGGLRLVDTAGTPLAEFVEVAGD